MGLDMYLRASKYVSGWSFTSDENKAEMSKLSEMYGVTPHEGSPSAEVSFTIGYWRKANAIHGWFVRELADGRDECQRIYVSRDNLETLRAECLKALGEKPALVVPAVSSTVAVDGGKTDPMTVIMDMMKVQAHAHEFNDETDTDPLRPIKGFFFGGTEKDEWYYEDLKDTVKICDDALAMGEEWSFEYHASW